MRKYHLYLIKWRDHFSQDGFFDPSLSDFPFPKMEFSTTGFFLKEDKNYYYLCRTIKEDFVADIMAILKNQILSIKEVSTNELD